MTAKSPTPRKKKTVLDESKPFMVVRGQPGEVARYIQGTKFYDANKEECGETPQAFRPAKPEPARTPARQPEKKLSPREQKIASLGKFNAVPKSVQEARQENAKAAAAEENAE